MLLGVDSIGSVRVPGGYTARAARIHSANEERASEGRSDVILRRGSRGQGSGDAT